MLYCEAELCLAASTFGRGGILSENRKGGQVTVHSAKNTTKFNSTVGRSATHADQVNLGVAAALRSNIYGGVPAQDKGNWKDLISKIGEESRKSKAKKKRKRQWNPLASCGTGCAGK